MSDFQGGQKTVHRAGDRRAREDREAVLTDVVSVLKKVMIGDEIDLEGVDGRTSRYRVTNTEVRRWDRFAVSSDRSMRQLALVTCYPFDAQTHGPLRFVVHAVEI